MAKEILASLLIVLTFFSCKTKLPSNSGEIEFLDANEFKTISLSEFRNSPKATRLENLETSIAELGSFTSSIAVAKSRTVFKENKIKSMVPRAIYVLSGSGKIHFGDSQLLIKQDDWVHFPAANLIDVEPNPGKVLKFLVFKGYWKQE